MLQKEQNRLSVAMLEEDYRPLAHQDNRHTTEPAHGGVPSKMPCYTHSPLVPLRHEQALFRIGPWALRFLVRKY